MIPFAFLLLVLLHVLPTCRCLSCPAPLSATTSDLAEFAGSLDYLIVGGGTAGLVLASRLTDDENIHVGVIEAGFYHGEDPLVDVPANVGQAAGNPTYDWNFLSTPTPGADDREISIARGKMIGGSTGLNNLAWTRASKDEYDAWETLTGDPQWSWEGLLPYLKRAESVFEDEASGFPQTSSTSYDPTFVNFEGPVTASFNNWYSDPFPLYQEAYASLGVPVNTSPDNGTTTGIANCRSDVTRPAGSRAYAAQAYYCRFGSRRNFHVFMKTQATRILLSRSSAGLMATGVQYVSRGQTHIVNVTREVILSSGVFQSPQLLELSGIGNKTLLTNLGIEPILDLPEVGENLQDHLFSASQFSVKPGVITFDQLRINETFLDEQKYIYNKSGSGALGSTDSALAFLTFDMFLEPSQIESLRVQFEDAVAQNPHSPLRGAQYDVQRKWLQSGRVPQTETIMWSKGIINPAANQSYITILSGALHPVFRGSVHVNSTNALAQPKINLNWLSNEFDLNAIAHVFSFAQTIPSITPLSSLIGEQSSPLVGMRNGTGLKSYLRETVASASHPMGTVPMARREIGGVLDSQLKVYGTVNLRVCDASVFPIGIGTHLQSTVYAVAEKLSDMIKDERRESERQNNQP